jgi:phospholipid/cholesterol/gamma-HCH transport system substrate-binding protein
METKANYTLIGMFTLAVVIATFGFIYWFHNIGGAGADRSDYRVMFDGSVSGLQTGAAVLFNGVRVGQVTKLSLDPQRPQQVIATMSINKAVVIRKDTVVNLEYTTITGIASIALRGGSTTSEVLPGSKDNPPLLAAAPGASQDVTQGARETLRRIDQFIIDNQEAFHNTLENLDKFTGALARNADRLDKITAGLANLTGGEDGKGGELAETARSIRSLADNVDKRTEEITKGINVLTGSTTKQVTAIGGDARRMIGTVEQTFKNIDRNPSRLLFGGGSSASENAPHR